MLCPRTAIEPCQRRSGFTLIELLIVVSVIVALAAITVVSVNFTTSGDRIRASATQIKSFLAGARDRAIYKKYPYPNGCGVRLILDPNNTHTVVAMQYVAAPQPYSEGRVSYQQSDMDLLSSPDYSGATVAGSGATNWIQLQNKGLLGIGSMIEIPKGSGNRFTIVSPVFSSGGKEFLRLNRPNRNLALAANPPSYELQLRPTTIPDAVPSQLPTGVVIDLDGSRLPAAWRPSSTDSTQPYSRQMDILFSPRGTVMGDAASSGLIHLHLANVSDVEQWRNVSGRVVKAAPTTTEWSPPVVPANDGSPSQIVKKDQILVTLNGLTGNTSIHPVDPTNTTPVDQLADDPFQFAETGEVSNQ